MALLFTGSFILELYLFPFLVCNVARLLEQPTGMGQSFSVFWENATRFPVLVVA